LEECLRAVQKMKTHDGNYVEAEKEQVSVTWTGSVGCNDM